VVCGLARQVFKRLYENTTSNVHVSVHLAILESIRDVCKRVVKELTSWVREKTYSSGLMLVIFSDNPNDLDFECKLEVKYL
jgi:hypothetical protein